MKKDIAGMIKRADRFKVILIGEGILVGLVAGAVVILYRVALELSLIHISNFRGREIIRQ